MQIYREKFMVYWLCGGTREECKKWKNMKPYAITKLRRDLGKRMTILNGEENG